jgi:parvulin-like peptidyl-prolyl isomerase
LLEVGSYRITAAMLAATLRETQREAYDEALQRLVLQQIVARENERHAVVVEEALLTADVERATARLEHHTRLQHQLSATRFLEQQGRSLATFQERARDESRYRRTLERLVRYEQMRLGAIKMRHIVTRDRSEAESVLQKLRDGADFVALARQHSICPTATSGGQLALVVPGQFAKIHPDIEQAIWSLQPGQRSPVVQASTGFHIFEVLDRHAPVVDYATAAATVIASLERYPLMDEEAEWWLEQMRERYPIVQHY